MALEDWRVLGCGVVWCVLGLGNCGEAWLASSQYHGRGERESWVSQ
jgi:hypothetical protein